MELMALFMYLLFSELTVQVYQSFGESVSQQSESVGWGLGYRLRIPVGARDTLRIRADGGRFGAKASASSGSEPELHTVVALDYLWRGRKWESGWYAGLGAGWLRRELPVGGGGTIARDSITGGVILGRGQKLGNGQIVLETRLEVSDVDGKVAPTAALSLAYRYHFKI